MYDISFSSNSGQLTEEETAALIVEAFNTLRRDVCDSQVVDAVVLGESQSEDAMDSLQVEVVALSASDVQTAVFSGDTSSFVDDLNSLIANSGSDASAESIAFVGPAVRCSSIRNTYDVTLVIEFESDRPLDCPPGEPGT